MKHKYLKNNLKLLTVPMDNTKTITALVMVATGSKYENRENNGISHFLEHMFFKGTKNRPNNFAISSELDGMGAEYNAFTTKEYTGFWIKAENKHFEHVLNILSDLLINPMLPEQEIEKEKGVIIEEINMYIDNPMAHIEDVFENCLYGDSPAGWDVIGAKENILKFSKKDFTNYLHSQYGAKNSIVCLIGNIKQGNKSVEKKILKYFEDFAKWGDDFNPKMPVVENQKEPQTKVLFKNSDQAHLALGVRTFSYNHADKIIAKMISVILGGSMSSRIWGHLREREGLGYYVVTHTEAYTDSGYLVTKAGVKIDEIEKSISIILEEYKKMADTSVNKKELERTKDLLRGRLALQLETSDNLAEWYGRQAVMDLSLEREKRKLCNIINPDQYIKEIEKISAGEIKRVAKKIFVKNNLNLAIIGPYKDENRFKASLDFK